MKDRELSDAFASVRAEDAARAPAFSVPAEYYGTAARDIAPVRNVRRIAWLIAASILAVSAAGVRMTMAGKPSRPVGSISTWQSPTDGLLGSTTIAIMAAPRIEAPSMMALPATHEETGK